MIRSLFISLTLVSAVVPSTGRSQAAPSIPLPNGRSVEVIGLRRWTIPMIQDSLRKYSPGTKLESSACARVLRYELHFADASVAEWGIGDSPLQTVVTVREPQDSARVHHRFVGSDSLGGSRQYRPVSDLALYHRDVFYPAAQMFLARIAGKTLTHRYAAIADSVAADRVVSFLSERRRPADKMLALRILAGDANMNNRMVAALILANFASSNESWWALADALREDDGWVIGIAGNVLDALMQKPTRVDWQRRSSSIHLMLDGSGLNGLPTLIRTLNATGVGPANARPFLRSGGDMITAYLGSSNAVLSESSHSLLVRLRGADLGREAAPWRIWIASL